MTPPISLLLAFLVLAGCLVPSPSIALEPPALCGTHPLRAQGAAHSAKPLSAIAQGPFAVGDQMSFRAFNFATAGSYTLTATCQLVGKNCYVFVQDEEWNTRVRFPQIDRLADAFDRRTAADSARGIFRIDTETFGPPPDGDADPRVLILVLDILDGYRASGDFFAGYFDRGNQAAPVSREILYVDDSPLDLDSRLARATLAHELQHMIHWRGDPNEEKWVEEGCSEYAERINGYVDTTGVGAGFLSFPDLGLTDWQDLPLDYEKAMLFISYFANRKGVASLMPLVQNRLPGIAGFDSALSEAKGSERFSDLFVDWAAANLLDAQGRYGYAEFQLAPVKVEKVELLPMGSSPRRVSQWAARYFDFGGQEGIRVGFEGTSGERFNVRLATTRSGEHLVLDVPLNEDNKGEIRAARADRAVAIVSRLDGGQGTGGFFISAGLFRPSAVSLADFDGDGRVGFGDFFLFAEHFGRGEGQAGFNPLFDLDGDRKVGLEDFFLFAVRFGSEDQG